MKLNAIKTIDIILQTFSFLLSLLISITLYDMYIPADLYIGQMILVYSILVGISYIIIRMAVCDIFKRYIHLLK
jgi:hypothetical protein